MTAMRDRDRAKASEIGLKICEACGWYVSRYTHSTCDPTAGRVADALAAAWPEGNPTKLGYGDGMLTFEISDRLHVRFQIHGRLIALRDVHVDFSHREAIALAQAIRAISELADLDDPAP